MNTKGVDETHLGFLHAYALGFRVALIFLSLRHVKYQQSITVHRWAGKLEILTLYTYYIVVAHIIRWFLQNLGKEAVRNNMHTTVMSDPKKFEPHSLHDFMYIFG